MNTQSNHSTALELIKTEVAAQVIDAATKYAENFSSFGKKTAHALIGMGKAVFEASETSDAVFAKFCELTHLQPKCSTTRKYIAIGKNHERLERYIDCLPNSWTVVYSLCTLDSDKFDALVKAKAITPALTGKTITETIKSEMGISSTKSKEYEFKVSIPESMSKEDLKRICDAFNKFAQKEQLKTNYATLEKFFSDDAQDATVNDAMPIAA